MLVVGMLPPRVIFLKVHPQRQEITIYFRWIVSRLSPDRVTKPERSVTGGVPAGTPFTCGYSLEVKHQTSNLVSGVRFPVSAPNFYTGW